MVKCYLGALLLLANVTSVAAQFHRMTLEEVLALGLPVVEVVTVDSVMPTATPIDHPEGASGFSVTDATKVPGRVSIWMPNHQLAYSSGDYVKEQSGMTIKIRGNNSARRKLKPYKIKLQKKADLLCRGDDAKYKDKNWLLLKEYENTLNIPIGFKVNELMDFSWTPSCRQVNLLLNGEYHGIYLLTEHVGRNPRCRIDVDKERGYIIERDIYWWVAPLWFESDLYHRSAPNWQRYTFKYPDDEDVTEQQIAYIRTAVNQMENAVLSGRGYGEHLDVNSFAAWTLGHDILGTYDGGGSNRFLIKYDDTPSSLFHMGTLWDFETNFYYQDTWSALHDSYSHYAHWLFAAPDRSFTQSYVRQWQALSPVLEQRMSAFLDSIATSSEATAIDSSRALEAKLRYRAFKSVAANVAEAKEWFRTRKEWLDNHITDDGPIPASIFSPQTANGRSAQRVNCKSVNGKSFDLTGRHLAAPPKKGVYIEGGKIRVKSME